MEILFFDEIKSTHAHALSLLEKKLKNPPFIVWAKIQSAGIGSRGNFWESFEGNLHLSVCVEKKQLPNDLPIASISIYFGMIIKEILASCGSKVWLKWPNDFYLNHLKIGGLMGSKKGENIVVSTGINLALSSESYGTLDIKITPLELIEKIKETLVVLPSWKDIFSKYEIEFSQSKIFSSHLEGRAISLSNAQLCEDGSIIINGKRVHNLR